MNRPLSVDLFAEDYGHEALLVPLIERVAREHGCDAHVHVRSARGGHGRALREYDTYQRFKVAGRSGQDAADIIVVAIDGNCSTFATKRQEIEEATLDTFRDKVVAACPDPHIERWYLLDPRLFARIVGPAPPLGRKKCERGHYKQLLRKAVRDAGHPATLGGIEFARDLATDMDLYRAGKTDRSFKAFLDDLRGRLRSSGEL